MFKVREAYAIRRHTTTATDTTNPPAHKYTHTFMHVQYEPEEKDVLIFLGSITLKFFFLSIFYFIFEPEKKLFLYQVKLFHRHSFCFTSVRFDCLLKVFEFVRFFRFFSSFKWSVLTIQSQIIMEVNLKLWFERNEKKKIRMETKVREKKTMKIFIDYNALRVRHLKMCD